MLPTPLPTTYRIEAVYGHRNQASHHVQNSNLHQEQPPLSYPLTPEQQPLQQVIASTSALRFPTSTLPPYYQQQSTLSSSSWLSQCYHLPVQSLGLFDDISPAFKGKAFIYDCMVRALESLSPEGASVKEIFDHVWLHNRALILARSRDGDTESGRRASTKNTIVNYLSTSPAFDSVGRNRWVLTGKRHGTEKRGRKFSRSAKRRPHNPSHKDLRGESDTASADSDMSSSSPSSTASPDIPSHPAHYETTWVQPSMNGSPTLDSSASAPLVNKPIVSHGPEAASLPSSGGLIQGPVQASASSTSSVPNDLYPREHQVQQRCQGGLIVSALPSIEAPFSPGMSGANATIPGAINNNHPQRETLSYGQSTQSTTSISTATVALARGRGTGRSFDAVPLILPPRPPRTLHPDNFDPFAVPIWTSAQTTPTASTSTTLPPSTAPCKPLFQIPSNTSYYEAPSVTPSHPMPSTPYTHQENSPSPTLSSSSFHSPRSLDQGFAQVDLQGDCAGTSIPVIHQHHNSPHIQGFAYHDTFAAPAGFV